MKVLLIGGTGNISGDVAEVLHACGHDVTTVTSGRTPVPPAYHAIHVDVRDSEAYRKALCDQEAEVVMNFLAFGPEDIARDLELFRGRVEQYIFISSATVYQKPSPSIPVRESFTRSNPFSEYARKKIACEDLLFGAMKDGVRATIVRPSHTFCHRWIPSPFSGTDWTVAARILAGKPVVVHDQGLTLWTLTSAQDFAHGVAGLVGNDAAIGEALHLTSDEPLTWRCIYQELGVALGGDLTLLSASSQSIAEAWAPAEAKLMGDKAGHGVFDNTKAKQLLPEWRCRKLFRDAIREAVAWYRADPARQVINVEMDALQDRLAATAEALIP